MNPVSGFGTSFDLTYFERKHGRQRPRLNETNIDPDFIKDRSDSKSLLSRALDKSDSAIALNWAWDISIASQKEPDDEHDASFMQRYNVEPSILDPILEDEQKENWPNKAKFLN